MAKNIQDLLNDEELVKKLAKAIVLNGFRNTFLEDIHAGRIPTSKHDDKRDVTVHSPDGKGKFKEIPWNEVSRIDQKEMKKLMIECVNNVYTMLLNFSDPEIAEALINGLGKFDPCPDWDEPQPNIPTEEEYEALINGTY